MILKLVEAIAQKIKLYYPGYDFINDKLEQNFGKTMHINTLPVIVKRIMGNRYNINARVIITIFNDDIDEIMELCRNMYSILEILEFGDEKIRGINFSFSIQNKTGVIDITYNIWEYLSQEEIKMRNYRYEGSVLDEKN